MALLEQSQAIADSGDHSPELRFNSDDSAFRPISRDSPVATSAEDANANETRRERKRKAENCGNLSGCGNCAPARRWKALKSDDEHDQYNCPLCLRTTANSPSIVSCRCSDFQRYHIGCFVHSLKAKKKCPLCRASLKSCWIVGIVQVNDDTPIKDYCLSQSIDEYRRWSSFLKILYKMKEDKPLDFDLKDTAFCGVYHVPQLVQTILTQFMLVTFTVDQILSAWDKFLSGMKRDLAKMEKKVKMTKLFLQHECSF